GAGDAHNGAFLGRIAQGDPLPQALMVGTAMGALCVQNLGARGYATACDDNLPRLIERASTTITIH
ncbi:MAG: PfkB family carbohydrate kinase, partial [Arachnia sp.]